MRIAPAVSLTEKQRLQLRCWARGRRTPARLVRRATDRVARRRGKAEQRDCREVGSYAAHRGLLERPIPRRGIGRFGEGRATVGAKTVDQRRKVKLIVQKTTPDRQCCF